MKDLLLMKDHVYNFIATKINDGTFQAGNKVNEQLICEELNISRTPVREALIQLAAEGYLENLPHKGFIISKLNAEKAIELYLVIGVLDGLAASLAAEKISEKELAHMRYLVSAMDLSLDSGMTEAYLKLQIEFHDVYINICGNSELIKLLATLKKSFFRFRYTVNDTIISMLKDTNAEHKKIIELFEAKDANGLDHYLRTVHWNFTRAEFDSM